MSHKPKRPLITIKGKGRIPRPALTTKPTRQQPPKAPPKPKGPSYTPPRAPVAYMRAYWLVMRDSGRRPKVRHPTFEEAQRIVAACPGASEWVIEARTVETITAPSVQAAAP
jgi:hypothetical protein